MIRNYMKVASFSLVVYLMKKMFPLETFNGNRYIFMVGFGMLLLTLNGIC